MTDERMTQGDVRLREELLTLAQIDELTGDDVAYWINNPFVDRAALAEKVRWWITRAVAATDDRAVLRDEEREALMDSMVAWRMQRHDARKCADALAPVVERIVAARVGEVVERVEALAREWDESGREAAAYQNRAHASEIHEVMAEARWFPARAAELRAEIAALRAADAPLSHVERDGGHGGAGGDSDGSDGQETR